MSQVELIKVSKNYDDTPAVAGFSLNIDSGELVTLVGASGCGKSTLLRLVAGLETPDSGQIIVDGQIVSGPGHERGMVFQGYSCFPWLTALENIEVGRRFGAGGQGPAAGEFLQLVGLSGFDKHYPYQLSGGMRQRVAIARALAARPKLLLMDEPFGALDSQTRNELQQELVRINQTTGMTILFVTHDIDEAAFLGKRIVVCSRRPATVETVIDGSSHTQACERFTNGFSELKAAIYAAMAGQAA